MDATLPASLQQALDEAAAPSHALQRQATDWLEEWMASQLDPSWKGLDSWRLLVLITCRRHPDGPYRQKLLAGLFHLWKGNRLPPDHIRTLLEALLAPGQPSVLPDLPLAGSPSETPLTTEIACRLGGAEEAGRRLSFLEGLVVSVDPHTPSLTILESPSFRERTLRLHAPWEYLTRLVWPGARLHLFNIRPDGPLDGKSLCVVEPDYMVDMTTIAGYVLGKHAPGIDLPEKYWLDRLTPALPSRPMVRGGILGAYLARRALHPALSHREAWRQALFGRMMDILQVCNDASLLHQWEADAPRHFEHLRKALHRPDDEGTLEAEVSYIIPPLGMRGRLDILHRGRRCRTVLELKSRERITDTADPSHCLQAYFYQLMVTLAEPDAPAVRAFVLYTADPQARRHRVDETDPSWLCRAVHIRNHVVGYEYWLAFRNVAILNVLRQKKDRLSGPDVPPWIRRQYRIIHQALERLAPEERDYLYELHGFMAREQWHAMVGSLQGRREDRRSYASLWRPLSGNSFDRVEDAVVTGRGPQAGDGVVFQYPSAAFFAARPGDAVVALPAGRLREGFPAAHRLLVGTVIRHTAGQVTVRFRDAAYWESPSARPRRWTLALETYIGGYWPLLRAMAFFVGASPAFRKLLLGKTLPSELPPKPLRTDPGLPLTSHQQQLLQDIIRGNAYYLLQGPPGTGKTRFLLRAVLYHYLQGGHRILLVGFTNRSVDEICSVLHEMGDVPFLRLGRGENTEHAAHTLEGWQTRHPEEGLSEWRERMGRIRCVVGTLHAVSRLVALHNVFPYRLVVMDEASQLLEPYAMGILARQQVPFVMVGDEKQLPAVTLQSEAAAAVRSPRLQALGFVSWSESFFGRMLRQVERHRRHDLQGMLREQGRMHRDIQQLASPLFYDGKLEPLPGPAGRWQTRPLDERDDAANPLRQARAVFIPVPAAGNGKENPAEVEAVTKAVAWCREVGVSFEEIGIIAPFRAQVAAIRRALLSDVGKDAEGILIDTVERFQGGQRRAIIISFTASTPSLLKLAGSPAPTRPDIDRKLNVMLTRAREYLILIGHPDVLDRHPTYRRLLNLLRGRP